MTHACDWYVAQLVTTVCSTLLSQCHATKFRLLNQKRSVYTTDRGLLEVCIVMFSLWTMYNVVSLPVIACCHTDCSAILVSCHSLKLVVYRGTSKHAVNVINKFGIISSHIRSACIL